VRSSHRPSSRGIAVLEQEKPDAAIVDPQTTSAFRSSIASGFDKIYPSLRGRAIVLSGKESEPEVKTCLSNIRFSAYLADRLLQELWGSLESLFHPIKSFARGDAAHLVFDSFLQPMPAGVRGVSQLPARQLVYQSGSLMADLWLEAQTDSYNSLSWANCKFQQGLTVSSIRFAVVLHGRKGPIPLKRPTSSANSQFHFNFGFEPSVTLEIEVRPAITGSRSLCRAWNGPSEQLLQGS